MQYYYHNTIKKYILAISSIFNDIHVIKTKTDNTIDKDIEVPISYGSKTKLFQNIISKNSVLYTESIDSGVGIVLPRIGFYDESPVYDIMRKRNNTIQYYKNGYNFEIGEPVPYDFPFITTVFTKNKDDMNQILEQILPLFNPDYVVTVNEIPELDIKNNISIQLDSVSYTNETEIGEDDPGRILMTDLNLTLHGWIYPPIKDTKLIEIIYTNMRDYDTSKLLEEIKIEYNKITITTF